MSVLASGSAATALGASTPPGTSPAPSEQTQQTTASPATQGTAATASDATTDTSTTSQTAQTQAETGATETDEDDDTGDGLDENAPVPYERFKKLVDGKNKHKQRATTAEASLAETSQRIADLEQRAQELDGYGPILERVRQSPEVQPYLQAGLSLTEAVRLAEQDAFRARQIRKTTDTDRQNLSEWREYFVEAGTPPELVDQFLGQFTPVLEENAHLRVLGQDVHQNAQRYQSDATIEGLMRQYGDADREIVTLLVRAGNMEGAKQVAERTHTAATTSRQSAAAQREQIEREAIARFQSQQQQRSETPTPAGAGPDGGEPITGAKPLLSGAPDPKKDPKGFARWFDQQAVANGRRKAGWT